MRQSIPALRHTVLTMVLLAGVALAGQQPAARAANAHQRAATCGGKVLDSQILWHGMNLGTFYLMENTCNGRVWARVKAAENLIVQQGVACMREDNPGAHWFCSDWKYITMGTVVDSPAVLYSPCTQVEGEGQMTTYFRDAQAWIPPLFVRGAC